VHYGKEKVDDAPLVLLSLVMWDDGPGTRAWNRTGTWQIFSIGMINDI